MTDAAGKTAAGPEEIGQPVPGELVVGRAVPGEPESSGSAETPRPTSGFSRLSVRPVRRKLPHGPPPFPVRDGIVQFVTINAAERGGRPFLKAAGTILDSARFYHLHGRWFLRLFLVMPDHLHMLATFPETASVQATCAAWKGFLRRTAGIRFQADCFEHRIRNAAEFSEKWAYIRENPVRKGLVAVADDWHFWLGFAPVTGLDLTEPVVPFGGASREPMARQGRLALPTFQCKR